VFAILWLGYRTHTPLKSSVIAGLIGFPCTLWEFPSYGGYIVKSSLSVLYGEWGVPITIYKNSFCTSQEAHYISATKTNWLMLFRGTVTVYYENQSKHTNRLFGQNIELVCSSGWYIQ
jgi:hypothetical protein